MAINPNQPLLVIEDSDEDFETLGRILRKLSLTIPLYRCIDGDDALDFLYRSGDYTNPAKAPRPGIIVLDLNLPGTDGRDVLEQIKQDNALKSIPVVVFTTSSNSRDIEACYRYGANGYMIKPMDTSKLMNTFRVFIDYWFDTMILPNTGREV